jgi:mannose-6-phosphate isomerase-like protein (cupin superfamily)
MIIYTKSKKQTYLPASHEDIKNPGSYKKIIYKDTYHPIKGKLKMINWAFLPKKKCFRNHLHQDMDEIFIILNGKVKIIINNQKQILERGDLVLIPKNQSHKMCNVGRIGVNYIAIGLSLGLDGKTIVLEK